MVKQVIMNGAPMLFSGIKLLNLNCLCLTKKL